jgi:ATP-dependent Zn protease
VHKTYFVVAFAAPILAFAQQTQGGESRFITALITWLPFLALIGLWIFFMKRMTIFGAKGGYREYVRSSQERLEKIENHLADIATSLRKIADSRGNSKE